MVITENGTLYESPILVKLKQLWQKNLKWYLSVGIIENNNLLF